MINWVTTNLMCTTLVELWNDFKDLEFEKPKSSWNEKTLKTLDFRQKLEKFDLSLIFKAFKRVENCFKLTTWIESFELKKFEEAKKALF